MNRQGQIKFAILRGAMALLVALVVTTIFIFVSIDASGDRFSATLDALYNLLVRPVVNTNGTIATKSITEMLATTIPTIFCALGSCVMFSANQFNLGTEGGIMLGAFVAALCAIYIPLPGGGVHLLLCLIIGAIAVALMMLIPAILKAKWDVSEMVCSLMLNYVIMYLIKYFMNTSLADKSKGQVQSLSFLDTAKLPQLIDNGSKLTWGFVVALIAVALTALFMYRTRWGYAIRMIGINKEFAKYSGIKVGFIIVLCQVIGGLLAGLGGGLEMLGRYDYYSMLDLPGYGWTGITIAVIAGNNPIAVPFAALLMSYLTKGCTLMATYCGVPSQLISIIQPTVFLFFAAEQFLSGYRQRLVVKAAQEEIAEKAASAQAAVAASVPAAAVAEPAAQAVAEPVAETAGVAAAQGAPVPEEVEATPPEAPPEAEAAPPDVPAQAAPAEASEPPADSNAEGSVK